MRNPVAFQSLRYVSVFFIPNIAFIIWAVIHIVEIQPSQSVYYAMIYLYVVVWPLFGALNSLVYFRLRFINERRSNPEASWTNLMRKTFTITPLSIRSNTNETHPLRISALIDEDDLSSPLFEDESASGSNGVSLSAAAAGGYLL